MFRTDERNEEGESAVPKFIISKDSSFVVTMDGPSASGKSSVSREVARYFGWPWVSTGAFYRGLAYVAKAKNIKVDHVTLSGQVEVEVEKSLVSLSRNPIWHVQLDDQRTRVFLEGQDVTDHIYSEEAGIAASKISLIPRVRESLLQAQRDCAQLGHGLVAEGRDCGTIIFPQAQVKIYLTARSEDRAERRAREEGSCVKEIKEVQQNRDFQDSSRTTAPLQIPTGALVLDTSSMDLETVVQRVIFEVEQAIQRTATKE